MSGESERSRSDEDRADAGQQDIGAVQVRGKAELTTQAAEPEDRAARPGVSDVIDKQGSHQDQRKDATHPLEGLHTHVFDIQPSLLVKAIGMFDPGPVAPLGVHGLGVCSSTHRDVGEQHEVAVGVGVVGDHGPQDLLGAREADHQPAQFEIDVAYLTRVGKGNVQLERQRHGGRQIVQQLLLPTLESVIVHLDRAVMARADGELGANQRQLLEELLVIQACVPDKAELGFRKQGAGGTNSAIELAVLTHEIGRHVGEPVGVGQHRFGQVDHGGRERRIPGCQPLLLTLGWGRGALHNGGDTFQLLGVRLLKVDRVQGHHQMRRSVLSHGPLSHAIQPLQQVSMAEARVPHKTVEPLGCGPERLLRAHYTPRHLRQQRRLAA